jgi:thiol-disulfide isomerase/thioredoxin
MKSLLSVSWILVAALGQTAWALQAPDFTLSSRPAGKGLGVIATPPAGNHINIQAPMQLRYEATGNQPAGKLKPTSAQEKKVLFQVPDGTPVPFEIQLYLCDDKKTYCESHKVKFTPSGQIPASQIPAAKPGTPDSTPSIEPTQAKPKTKTHGFLLNQPEQALALAKKEQKPLLIDFFGIWCPPCNMLDEEVFSSREFQKSAGRFVRLKLDADSEISWKLKSRYKVGGYPTVIFADSEGDEISRVVGYLPRKFFLAKVEDAWNSRSQGSTVLKAKAESGDLAASERIGLTCLERREYEAAVRYLKNIKGRAEELANAEIGLAESKKSQSEAESLLAETLERAIKNLPQSPASLEWRMKLAESLGDQQSEKKKAQIQGAIDLARELIAHPERLGEREMSVADVWVSLAQAQEEMPNAADEAKRSWKQAAVEYKKKAGNDQERGHNLERAYCLWKSGDFAAADRLYDTLEKKYPDEFTFFYSHASMKLEQKDLPQAEKLAAQALKFSYGDNRLRSTHLLARVYQAEGKSKDGIELIHQALQNSELPQDESIRTHRYASSLKKLLEKLQAKTGS